MIFEKKIRKKRCQPLLTFQIRDLGHQTKNYT
jgi:hypothetical protein